MSTCRPQKYQPELRQRTALYLVPPTSSHGVGAEADVMASLLADLSARLTATMTLGLAAVDEDGSPVRYDHVQGTVAGTVAVRYRDAGRMLPRQILVDDE